MAFEEIKERFWGGGYGKQNPKGFEAEFGPGTEIESSSGYSNSPDMGGEGM